MIRAKLNQREEEASMRTTAPLIDDEKKTNYSSTSSTPPQPSPLASLNSHIGDRGSKKWLERRLPVFRWLKEYNSDKFWADLVAGLSVGLTVIPQSIGYAAVAKLPPQYGLYSSFVGCFVYALFGSTAFVTIGPTAIVSMLTASASETGGPRLAIALAFFNGIIATIVALFGLGWLVDFVSEPVIAAFTTGSALVVASGQLHALVGQPKYESSELPGIAADFGNVVDHADSIHISDLVLGLICLLLLFLLQILPRLNRKSTLLRLLGSARNAIVVVLALLLDLFLLNFMEENRDSNEKNNRSVFVVPLAAPPSGLPSPQWPLAADVWSMLSLLGATKLFVVPLMCVLESISIARALTKGKGLDSSQEIFSIGLSNCIGSFFGSYPVTGSFCRSSINYYSGVKTPINGIYTGCLVIVSLLYLMPLIPLIPTTVLAAIIIGAVLPNVQVAVTRAIFTSKLWWDVATYCVTLCGCLLVSLEFGVLAGIVFNAGNVFIRSTRPTIHLETKVTRQNELFYVIRPEHGLSYPSTSAFRAIFEQVLHNTQDDLGVTTIVIDFAKVHDLDFASLFTVAQLLQQCNNGNEEEGNSNGAEVIFAGLERGLADQIERISGQSVVVVKNTNVLLRV